jgi:hypothetical protein
MEESYSCSGFGVAGSSAQMQRTDPAKDCQGWRSRFTLRGSKIVILACVNVGALFSCNPIGEYRCIDSPNSEIVYSLRTIDELGNVISEYAISNDCMRNGVMSKYHENGYISEVGYYYRDSLVGPFYSFNPDGTIISIHYYNHDILDGISRHYLPNGRLNILCQYDKGDLLRCDSVKYCQ